jgi:hypothetical protein
MQKWRWDEASFLINIHAVLPHDVNVLTLFHITVHMQVLNANVKLTSCEAISWRWSKISLIFASVRACIDVLNPYLRANSHEFCFWLIFPSFPPSFPFHFPFISPSFSASSSYCSCNTIHHSLTISLTLTPRSLSSDRFQSLMVASSALIFDSLTSEILIWVHHAALNWWLILPCSSRWWNRSSSILSYLDRE